MLGLKAWAYILYIYIVKMEALLLKKILYKSSLSCKTVEKSFILSKF